MSATTLTLSPGRAAYEAHTREFRSRYDVRSPVPFDALESWARLRWERVALAALANAGHAPPVDFGEATVLMRDMIAWAPASVVFEAPAPGAEPLWRCEVTRRAAMAPGAIYARVEAATPEQCEARAVLSVYRVAASAYELARGQFASIWIEGDGAATNGRVLDASVLEGPLRKAFAWLQAHAPHECPRHCVVSEPDQARAA